MTPDTPQSLVSDRSSAGATSGILKAYACLPCRERKIKCDRHNPCSHCVKVNRQCSFVAPVRGKRKSTKPARESLHARLQRYEDLLRSVGVDVDVGHPSQPEELDSPVHSPQDTVLSNDVESVTAQVDLYKLEDTNSKLITKEGSSKYFDSSLWWNLGDEFQHPGHHSQSESTDDMENEEDLILEPDYNPRLNYLHNFHPSLEVLSKLQIIYIERVDPLMKILHLPTFWLALKEAQSGPQRPPKSSQALMSAFYLVTTSSLQEDECQMLFGLEKSTLLSRYKHATRRTLTNAGLLSTSSPTTLAAYALYLMATRNHCKADALYTLSGVAVRLARKMGLHRDGTSLGLNPFDTEMRRRLWWHIVTVDYHTADIQGTRPSMDLCTGDTKMPLNVDDDDLQPGMSQPPIEREAILPVSISLIKCEITETLRKFAPNPGSNLRFEVLSSSEVKMERKESIINDLESHFESKYLRYLDPSNPLHTFTSLMIRSSICKMRLFAYRPQLGSDITVRQSDPKHREKAFANATKLLEYIVFMHGDHFGGKRFIWQLGPAFLVITMLYVLIEMKYQKTGPKVDKTWQLIGKVFGLYPEIFQATFRSAYAALTKWTLDVWNIYITTSMAQNLGQPPTPEFIISLRQHQQSLAAAKTPPPTTSLNIVSEVPALPPLFRYGTTDSMKNVQQTFDLPQHESYDFAAFESMDLDSNDWSQWEQLFAEPGPF